MRHDERLEKLWQVGNSFDHLAAMSYLHLVASVGHLKQSAIWLQVNGETEQFSKLRSVIWSDPRYEGQETNKIGKTDLPSG